MSGGLPLAGAAVAVGAATSFELSYALQALEARAAGRRSETGLGLLRRLARRRLFGVAVLLSGAGYALQVLALGLAPLTVVQPVLALGLGLLLFLAARVLGEHVGWRELAGVAVVVAGVAVIAVASPRRVVIATPGTALVVAMGVLALVSLVPALGARRGFGGGVALAVGAGAGDALAALAAKLISDDLASGRTLRALGWAGIAGAAVLTGLSCELAALQRMTVARVAPLVLGMQIAVPVALAPAVLGEQWGTTPLSGGVLVLGLAAVTGGAAWLASSGSLGELLSGQRQHE